MAPIGTGESDAGMKKIGMTGGGNINIYTFLRADTPLVLLVLYIMKARQHLAVM